MKQFSPIQVRRFFSSCGGNLSFITAIVAVPMFVCAVFDLDWERQAAETLDAHPAVRAWVKNDRLGLIIPYRKDGVLRRYFPDFVVDMTEQDRHLIVEIKGQAGDAAIKKAAAERWCRAVTNDGRHGRWTYHLCFGVGELITVLEGGGVSMWPLHQSV